MLQSFKYSSVDFLVLVGRIAWMVLLSALLRVLFYIFNANLFPQVDIKELIVMFFGGFKFDLVSVLYVNILYILMCSIPFPFRRNKTYRTTGKWIYIVTNSIAVLINLIDFVYYPFTLKRTTGTVFSQFKNETNLGRIFADFFIDYWYMFILFAGLVFLIFKSYRWFSVKCVKTKQWTLHVFRLTYFLLVIFLFIGGVRGGWAHSTRPITINNAGDFVNNPEEISIVVNTPFSIMKTMKAHLLEEKNYFSQSELKKVYYPVHVPKNHEKAFNKLNVVFIIMESFGKEHIGSLNKSLDNGNYKGYTPFLDSLIAESLTFAHTYANGRKSIDALPSILSSIPSIGEPFVLSPYSNNRTTSIGHILGNEGYSTAFFHGAPNGSMGFSAYTKLAGIKQYFGKDEYDDDRDFDGIWGIWDEPFMQFMAKELDQMQQPFFASFFSLSSHHPFKVPDAYENVFPKGPLPVQEPVGYSDHALRKFFESARQMPWFENTLFVITADHATTSYYPEYNTVPGLYAIPIIFYQPKSKLKGVREKVVQQLDIIPTVLNYLGYNKPYFSFGFDAFDNTEENFVINNNGQSFNLFYQDYLMIHDGEKAISLFNLKLDKQTEHNLIDKKEPVQDIMGLKLKAFIQQYNNRMIHNDLTVSLIPTL